MTIEIVDLPSYKMVIFLMLVYQRVLWMVAKSCNTWDGRKPINNGINHR